MDNQQNNLKHNLLTYIAYCIKNRFFSYEKCQKDLAMAGINAEITTLRKIFSQLKTEGLIEFKTYYRRPYPVLSSKGRFEIKTHLPFKKYGWDETWKMVIFELPESRRQDRLDFQRQLIELGFGKITRGVYLSPHPLFSVIKRYAIKHGIGGYITYAKTSLLDDEKKKIYQAWDLPKINSEYEKFIKKAKSASAKREPLWPLIAKNLEKEFSQIYARDPHLPEEILPTHWRGREAYGVFKAISNSY